MKVLFALSLLVWLAAGSEVVVRLSLTSVDPPTVGVSFTNPTSDDTALLNWNTPLEGIYGDIFDVYDVATKERVAYTGILVRRGETPLEEEFTVLRPGETVSVLVDLWQYYALQENGQYMVSLHLPEYLGVCKDVLYVTVGPALPPLNKTGGGLQGYVRCSGTQISATIAAVQTAASATKRAFDCLTQRTCDALSVRWFGNFSNINYNYLRTTYTAINSRLADTLKFNAECNPPKCPTNVYGYVNADNKDSLFTVYLCNLFFTTTNTNRVSTIVHEMSHFKTLGASGDYAYGLSACLNLALTNPPLASHNADNLAFFSQQM